jgi:D-3-phosphoglycerate dehydrogenase / 2-oxoglutarate reductase
MKTSYPKDKINILLLENISPAAVKRFTNNGYANVKLLKGALSEAELIKEVKNVHILGIRSKTQVTKAVLDAAPKLQAIGCFCIGVNQVNLKAATTKGVAVFNAPYSNTRSVAELVIGACIMLIRKIPEKNNAAHNGVWLKDAAGSYELRGKTLGIIGYGNIGSQVSILAEALGMKVLYYDTETKLPLGNANDAKNLKSLVAAADIVSVHVPSLPSTSNFINKNLFKHFKKDALFINYARGEVVNIDDLAAALKSGHLAGAAVDVYPQEPEANGAEFSTPLQNLPNVLLTPHIGGSTYEAQQNIGEDVSIKLFNYLENGSSYGSHTVPAISLPAQEGTHRILHIHENVPGVLSEINATLLGAKVNILGQYLKTNEQIGYVVLDINKEISDKALKLLQQVKSSIKVRMVY